MIKEVTAHQTEDGKVFLDKNEAEEYQNKINRQLKVEEIVRKFYFRGMFANDLIEGILQNLDDLKKIR